MQRIVLCIALLAMFTISPLNTSMAANAADETYNGPPVTLIYSNYYPETNIISQVGWKPFLTRALEASGGKIQFKEYWSGSLHGLNDGFNAAKAGITDVTQAYCHTHGGMFQLMHASALPMAFRNPAVASRVMEELYPKYFKKEYEKHGVYLNTMNMINSGGFISTKPIRTLEDMKGLRLFTGGGIPTDTYGALGAVSVAMSGADVFSALQRGVIDGVCFPKGIIIPRRLHEIAKYYIDANLCVSDIVTCISIKKFDSLPKPLKPTLYRVGRESSFTQTAGYMDLDIDAEKELIAAGVEIIKLSPEEKERWRQATMPVWDKFVAENEKKGLPARQMVEDLRALAQKYNEFSLEELKDLSINSQVQDIISGM